MPRQGTRMRSRRRAQSGAEGEGLGRDESALMFCQILPPSSILSCFPCLSSLLTGGDRMFSLERGSSLAGIAAPTGRLPWHSRALWGSFLGSFLKPSASSLLPHVPLALGPLSQQHTGSYHRVTGCWLGRDPPRVSCPTPCTQQGQCL